MATEIERKFLVKNDSWHDKVHKRKHMVQGYLANTERGSIRIRLAGDEAHLNIKSMTLGVTRTEYDYPIPASDAHGILKELCMQPLIEKTRYYVTENQHTWEIDVFAGENAGLIVAEIELKDKDEAFDRPGWLGDEVSDDPRYYNVSLVEKPFSCW